MIIDYTLYSLNWVYKQLRSRCRNTTDGDQKITFINYKGGLESDFVLWTHLGSSILSTKIKYIHPKLRSCRLPVGTNNPHMKEEDKKGCIPGSKHQERKRRVCSSYLVLFLHPHSLIRYVAFPPMASHEGGRRLIFFFLLYFSLLMSE